MSVSLAGTTGQLAKSAFPDTTRLQPPSLSAGSAGRIAHSATLSSRRSAKATVSTTLSCSNFAPTRTCSRWRIRREIAIPVVSPVSHRHSGVVSSAKESDRQTLLEPVSAETATRWSGRSVVIKELSFFFNLFN